MADGNHADDRIERELGAFRAQPLSAQLRDRIGDELGRRQRIRRVFAVACLGSAAACVAGGLAVWTHRTSPQPGVGQPSASAEMLSGAETSADATPFSIVNYQRALAESPGALDALLTRRAPHARRTQPEPLTAFSRPAIELGK